MEQKHFIREWRRYRGLTMEELANQLDISESVVSRIERGEQRYNQDFLEAVALVLACSPGDLLTRDPSDPVAASLSDLSPAQRAMLAAMAKTLKEHK